MFDLAGNLHSAPKSPVYVECKNYSTTGGQPAEFQEFLAIAYSASVQEVAEKGEHARELWFMWVTYHPFASTRWAKLESGENMVKALQSQPPGFLNGKPVDPVLAHEVSARVSIMVANHRHDHLSLTAEELSTIRHELDKMRGA